MNLAQIIKASQQDRELIKKEWTVMSDFLRANQYLLKRSAYHLEIGMNFDVERILAFKEDLFIDNLIKIYHQIEKYEEQEFLPFGYYKIIKGLYNSQLKKGFVLGDKDHNGRLVSGSNIIIASGVINVQKFRVLYSTQCN